MIQELSFKALPFVPEVGQVIYIESAYDNKLNKFILENYRWLRDVFRKQQMDFCYLPKLAEELLVYHAPYLSESERLAKVTHVPSLSEYIVQGSVEVPSLCFLLRQSDKDAEGNALFKVIAIDPKWYRTTRSTFVSLAATISLYYKGQQPSESPILVEKKRGNPSTKKLPDDEDLLIPKVDDNEVLKGGQEPKSNKDDKPHLSEEPKPKRQVKYSRKVPIDIPEPDLEEKRTCRFRRRDTDKADNEFDYESQLLIDEIKERINALRNKGVNTMFLHDVIDENQQLSRLKITKDYRIILLDYDNMEIKMADLPKAVFFLFLRHPEGIRFKELSDYYSELLQIYLKMDPQGGRSKQEKSIKDITNPCSNSINEKCARIREAFVSSFDDCFAKHYYVTGKRGEAKRILLDESMILWE